MNKTTVVIIISVLVLAGVAGYFLWNKRKKDKWDSKCISTGGNVIKSGEVCDYLNCDRSKYRCNIYGI